MENSTLTPDICKSVFKSATVDERIREFNRMWIELINRMEQQHSASAHRQK